MVIRPDYRAAADEIMEALWNVMPADECELGEVLDGLCRKVDEFRQKGDCDRATECCETGRRMVRQLYDSTSAVTSRFGEGFILMQLGTICLTCQKLEPTVECFRQAMVQFQSCDRRRSQSVAWMAIGETYWLTEEWEKAMNAFQQSLTLLKSLRPTDRITIELKERVEKKLEQVQSVFFDSIANIGQVVASSILLREDEVLDLIYSQASKSMDTNNMYIALYDEVTDTVRFGLAFVNGKRVDVKAEKGWQPKGGKERTEEIIRTRKPIFTATKVEAEAWYAQPEHKEYVGTAFASWLGVPMMVGEKVLGVIASYHPTQDYVYSGDDLEILQAMANQAAIALYNATLYNQAEKRRSQLEKVQEVAKVITAELEPRACMERILDETMKLVVAHYATIQLVDEATDELVLQVYRDVEGKGLPPELRRVKIGSGVTGLAAQEKRTIRLGNVEDAGYYLNFIGKGIRSEMATPLIEHGKVIGVLNVEDPKENAFDQDDEDIFKLLAEHVVVVIQNARRVEASRKEQERQAEAKRFEYLGLLAGGVAHRVGSKGGLIRLHVNNLRELIAPDNRDAHTILDKIERDNEYLIELSDALFKPAYAAETPVGPVDVNQLLRQAVRQAAIPSDIKVSFHPGDVPRVDGNKWLVDVFVELITNAVRAMSERAEKRLTIRSQQIDESTVAVVFEDTGHGIAPEEWSRLFDLFYTRDRRGEIPARGGYGLWYSKSIVTRMGGDLRIESEVDKGTKCIVLLPAAKEGGQA